MLKLYVIIFLGVYMVRRTKNKKYQDYLETFNKEDLITILDAYHIEYKKNQKKEQYIKLILENLNQMVDYMLDMFQTDEFNNIKYVVKHQGIVRVKFNYLLINFLDNLVRHKVVFQESANVYHLPIELCHIFKTKIKNKSIVKKFRENTHEYNLINGIIDAYGIVEFNYFYNIYSKQYKLQKENALARINNISSFYNEYQVYTDKKTSYLASNMFKRFKASQEILNNPTQYAVYTIDEYIAINNFNHLASKKAYKKLVKFIDRNYQIAKGSFKIVNKFILAPYFAEYQFDKENARLVLATLIDKYFEFKNDRQKEKIMDLIANVALEYPRWDLKGHSEREKVC